MTDDPKIRAMLSLPPLAAQPLPERPTRIDFSRCVVYPTQSAQEAMGLFKKKYGVEPVLCLASNIGGKKYVSVWVVGYVPLDWKEK